MISEQTIYFVHVYSKKNTQLNTKWTIYITEFTIFSFAFLLSKPRDSVFFVILHHFDLYSNNYSE